MTGILICMLTYILSCREAPSNAEVSQVEMILGILEWIRADHDTLWHL